MKTIASRIACTTLAALLLASCESPPVTHRNPRSVALIMSGDFVSYSSTGFGARISVVEVDGKPVKEPYGPVELAPGRHTVMLACDGAHTPHTLTVAAGEVYQFVVRTRPGAKGCVGALSRVRKANP
jgi:hypothetical protein